MFFVLSKVFDFFLNPVLWVALLWLFSFLPQPKLAPWTRRARVAALVVFLVFSNGFIAACARLLWEVEPVRHDALEGVYDYGVVLSGGMVYSDHALGRINVTERVDRLLQAFEAYRRGSVKKLVLSGGVGQLLPPNEAREADVAFTFLKRIGVPEEDILVEARSTSTRWNAVYTAEMLGAREGGKRVLLITSGLHMRRAEACFEKVGLAVDPFTTNNIGRGSLFDLKGIFLPNAGSFYTWQLLLHELVGYPVYWIAGYL